MSARLGQAAFQAYASAMRFKEVPEFLSLPLDQQVAWEAAADAVWFEAQRATEEAKAHEATYEDHGPRGTFRNDHKFG